MTHRRSRSATLRRSGFTLLEIMVACILMVVLSMLLSAVWSGMGRPLAEAVARARVTQEATMARASLSRDWGGALPGSLGTSTADRLVGREIAGGTELRLCFDGGSYNGSADWAAPDTVISYQVQANELVRVDESTGASFTVAKDVQSMAVTDLGDAIQIDLTLQYRGITRTYTFVARNL